MHALIENGVVIKYPYGIGDLKRDYPLTSFPASMDDFALLEFGVHRIFFSTPPTLTSTEVLEEDAPVFDVEAQRWTQVWRIRNKTQTEIDNEYQAAASAIRSERDQKLKQSDWTQLADAPVNKADWIVYRQGLRDITEQKNFPWKIEWPIEP